MLTRMLTRDLFAIADLVSRNLHLSIYCVTEYWYQPTVSTNCMSKISFQQFAREEFGVPGLVRIGR